MRPWLGEAVFLCGSGLLITHHERRLFLYGGDAQAIRPAGGILTLAVLATSRTRPNPRASATLWGLHE